MSIWDNYKTSVRTRIRVKQSNSLLTERQWKLRHYVKLNDKCGKYLWVNAYCPNQELYLWDKEVRPMTEQELAKYRADEKNKRIAQAKRKKQADKLSAKVCNISNDVIVIDTETTGLSPYDDELLQVSIIDGQGNTLFNSYIKPQRTKSWDEAMKINNITPETVATAPNILEVKQEISSIINSANTIIGYNVGFDLGFLAHIGIENKKAVVVDIMKDFAEIYGEWSEQYGCNKWQKLTKCAEYYGYDWGADAAHDSLADCRATLYCYQKIKENNIL